METLMKGDIVVIPFPFSDLTDSKLRPAMRLQCSKVMTASCAR